MRNYQKLKEFSSPNSLESGICVPLLLELTAILAVMRYSITDTEQDGEVISSISLSPSAPSAPSAPPARECTS